MTDPLDPDAVTDRPSFERFVEALVADRERAEEAERRDPAAHAFSGADGWQNASISAFLECALAGARDRDDWGVGAMPTWRDLALFLLLGKVYE